MENSKLQIVRNNMNLTPNEIKKKLRKTYPNISNDEVIKLIIEVDKKEKIQNGRMLIAKRDNRGRKPKEKEELERQAAELAKQQTFQNTTNENPQNF